MTEHAPFSAVKAMVSDAERHAEAMAADRARAGAYYRGEMPDLPSDPGRSDAVSRDVRAHIKKVLPSIKRTIFGSETVVEYLPVGEGDEERAQQASDFVNHVLMDEARAVEAVEAAIHDALLNRNGILKWWYEERQSVKISRHSGLTEDDLGALAGSPDVEVLEHSDQQEITDAGPVTLHDIKIKRTYLDRRYRVAAVPRERFLIHSEAVTLADSLLVGEKTEMRRSDLLAMGYDRNQITELSVADGGESESNERRGFDGDADEAAWANQPLDYYDLFVRIDLDGDGIAELRHMTFAGGLAEKNLLSNEECDEVQFCDVAVMRQPHQWEGISLFDDLEDLQRGKTVLLRQTLDNLYWQNNPQMAVQSDLIHNPEAVFKPEFGKPIILARGANVREAVQFMQIPFVAQQSFGMLDYLDQEATDRTGVSDASAGLAPDALQNMTAKASAMIEQAGIGQTEMMVSTIADGLHALFRGMLRLVVRHQDKPRTVRLRDKWVPFDPRDWNADMDCRVNTGLGAGTRERDMMVMQQVLGLQEKLLAAFGPNNPFVKPDNLYASVAKLVESAGLRTPALYFTEPNPEEIEALLKAQSEAPDPERMKVEAQIQIEQAKLQTAQAKEKAQMDADLQVKRAEIEAESVRQRDELASKAALQEQMLAWERERFYADQRAKAVEAQQRAQAEAIRPYLGAA